MPHGGFPFYQVLIELKVNTSVTAKKAFSELSWLTKSLIIIVAFIASFALAYYLNGKSFYLPNFLVPSQYFQNDLMQTEESTLDGQTDLLLPSEQFQKPLQTVNIPKIVELPETGQSQIFCIDHSLGELQVQNKNGLYYWTDEQGIKHISDKKPKDTEYQMLTLAGEQVLDYFSLNITGSDVPFEFKEKLTRYITKLFAVYGQLLSKAELKKVVVNLKFITSKTAFEQYKARYAPGVNSATGFYSNGSNQAVIFYSNYENAFSTALHETAHAINRAVVGNTAKWLNEGLAEYLENIEVNLSSAIIKPSSDWLRNGQLKYPLIDLNALLISSVDDWKAEGNQSLYAASWTFVYFMMDDPSRKKALARFIRREQENLCNTSSLEQTLKHLGFNLSTLQNDFKLWLHQTKFTNHHI